LQTAEFVEIMEGKTRFIVPSGSINEKVPPKEDRPVYCRECFQNHKQN